VELTQHTVAGIVHDVYDIMRERFLAPDPNIDAVMSRILEKKGKGVRPIFMALVAELVGGSWESVRQAAVVIEAIHLASLLHDDVVDGAELRRGVPSLNSKHSNKVSVLFGDLLLSNALEIMDCLDNGSAVSIIHQLIKRMVRGEIRDTLDGMLITEEQYLEAIEDKTASMFSASGELSVLFSGVEGDARRWARELGETVGMAFQIIDDTLDYNGNKEVMGKSLCMDLLGGHATLPLIYSLRGMSQEKRDVFLSDRDGSHEDVCAFVRERGGIDYSYRKAEEYSERAREIVRQFDNSRVIPAFEAFIRMIMNRHH